MSDQAHVLEGRALEKALAQLRVEGGPSGRPERSCGRVSSRTRLFADELLFAELAALTTVGMSTKGGTKMTSVSEVF